MIQITATVEQSGGLKERLAKILAGLKGPTKVKVGFPAGKVAGDLISIAYWNHEGTSRAKGDVFLRNGKVGISGPIPPRPFLTIAMMKGRGQVRAFVRSEAKALLNGERQVRQSLDRLGMLGVQLIQDQIGSNMGPANSPMTVELKGSSATLIDTGRMRQSVTWKVDE